MNKIALAAQGVIAVLILFGGIVLIGSAQELPQVLAPPGSGLAQVIGPLPGNNPDLGDPLHGNGPLGGAGPLLGVGPLLGAGPLIGAGPLQGDAPLISGDAFGGGSLIMNVNNGPPQPPPLIATLPPDVDLSNQPPPGPTLPGVVPDVPLPPLDSAPGSSPRAPAAECVNCSGPSSPPSVPGPPPIILPAQNCFNASCT